MANGGYYDPDPYGQREWEEEQRARGSRPGPGQRAAPPRPGYGQGTPPPSYGQREQGPSWQPRYAPGAQGTPQMPRYVPEGDRRRQPPAAPWSPEARGGYTRTGPRPVRSPAPVKPAAAPPAPAKASPPKPAAKKGARWGCLGAAAVVVGLFAWFLVSAYGGSGSQEPVSSPAMPAAYTQAVSTMTRYCTQDAGQLGNMISAVQGIEAKADVSESLTSIATHLATVVSANGKDRMSCVQEFAAYATLRTGG